MLKFSLVLLALPALLCAVPSPSVETPVTYDGFKVLTISVEESQLALLDDLNSQIQWDTWREPHISSQNALLYNTDVMVSKGNLKFVTDYLQSYGLKYEVKIEDVGVVVKEEKEASIRHQAQRRKAGDTRAITWDDYYRYAQINDWVDQIVAQHSDIASVRSIGETTQGRDIKLVKISKAGSPANKSAVLIDGGFHAREWISPSVATYIINDLLTNRQANAANLDALDYYIIPLLNSDGYEYSHTNVRMWRKTRSNHASPSGCMGVDPNRNSDFHFGGGGTSNDKCSDIYRGPYAFSEPETAALQNLVIGNSINWQSYFTIHSYGLMWLTPWSWTRDSPVDTEELQRFGRVGAAAIQSVHGTRYTVGESSRVYGITAGSSDDWAHGVAQIKYSQTIEVRGSSFILPPAQILPTCEETWEGIRASTLDVARRN